MGHEPAGHLEVIGDFLGSQNGRVPDALSASLLTPNRPWYDIRGWNGDKGFLKWERGIIGKHVNTKGLQAQSPSIDVTGVLTVAAKINTPTFWDKLLPDRLGPSEEGLVHAYAIPSTTERRQTLVKALSESGARILVGTTSMFFLAALAGRNLDQYADQALRQTDEYKNVALAVAAQFEGPAQSPEELLARLRQLFPTEPSPTSAFAILERSGYLQRLHLQGSNEPSTDVARLVSVVYGGLGQVLARENVGQRVESMISRNQSRRNRPN